MSPPAKNGRENAAADDVAMIVLSRSKNAATRPAGWSVESGRGVTIASLAAEPGRPQERSPTARSPASAVSFRFVVRARQGGGRSGTGAAGGAVGRERARQGGAVGRERAWPPSAGARVRGRRGRTGWAERSWRWWARAAAPGRAWSRRPSRGRPPGGA